MPPGILGRYKMISGHDLAGVHQILPRPSAYVAMVRNPVEQFISGYYFSIQQGYIEHDPSMAGLQKYAESHLDMPHYAPQLEGLAIDRHFPLGPGQSLNPQTAPLESILAWLDKFYLFIGLTERYEETVLAAACLAGFESVPVYIKRNVTRKRPKAADLPDETLQTIKEALRKDLQVYEHCRDKFEHLIRGLRSDLPHFSGLVQDYRQKRIALSQNAPR